MIEPEWPIIDSHVHLLDQATDYRYFIEDIALDIAECDHNVMATMFVECYSMYRAEGRPHMKPVCETEFAAGQGGHRRQGQINKNWI